MTSRRQFIHSTGALALATALPGAAAGRTAASIATRTVPGTEESLGIVGLGNAKPFSEGDVETSRSLIELLLSRGGSYIDTSGSSRDTVGKLTRELAAQQSLFLGTYIDGKDLPSMRTEIAAVLKTQGGDSLDLVITRDPVDFAERRDEFRALKDSGLTRYVGVGRHNKRYYPAMMDLMRDGALDFIQVNYSIMEPEAADEILPLATQTKTAVIINRPFINGDYFGLVRGQALPAWVADFDCDSWAQFSLKYILAHPAVICVLTETSNPKHAIDNLGAGVGRLPDDEQRRRMEEIIHGFM